MFASSFETHLKISAIMQNELALSQTNTSSARIRRLHAKPVDRIGVKLANGIEFIHIDDIICCEAWGNYCKIHLADRKDALLVSKTLKHVSSVLPQGVFFRTHQSFAIRLNTIKSVTDEIVLNNGMRVPLSRRHRPTLMTWLTQNITLI